MWYYEWYITPLQTANLSVHITTKGPDLQTCEQEVKWGQNFLRSETSRDPSASGQHFGEILIGGSNHVKDYRDSQVNYNIAEDSFSLTESE